YLDAKNLPREAEMVRGVRVMPLTTALCRVQPSFFDKQSLSAEIALRAVKSVDELVRCILESESPALAARIAGAYQFLGDTNRAEQIVAAVRAAGIGIEPKNPFDKPVPMLSATTRLTSAYAGRIHAMFMNAREPVLKVFADVSPPPVENPQTYLDGIDAVYEHDAYNSLSIEGYSVTPELIDKIRLGSWNPDGNAADHQQVAAMAAKGYLEAF